MIEFVFILPKRDCWYEGLLSLAGQGLVKSSDWELRLEKFSMQWPSCERNAGETSMASSWLLQLEVKQLVASGFIILWPVSIQKQQVMQLQLALLVLVLRDSGLNHNPCNSPETSCQLTFALWPHWWIYSRHKLNLWWYCCISLFPKAPETCCWVVMTPSRRTHTEVAKVILSSVW